MKKILFSAACLIAFAATAFTYVNNTQSEANIDLLSLNSEALAQDDILLKPDLGDNDWKQCWLDPAKDYSCNSSNPKKDGCAPCNQ